MAPSATCSSSSTSRPLACPVTAPAPAAPREAHVCPLCGSPLVHPTEWQRIAAAAWRITLRCPNCETVRTVTLSREEVERLNRALYEGTEHLARQADQLVTAALRRGGRQVRGRPRADLILPIDF